MYNLCVATKRNPSNFILGWELNIIEIPFAMESKGASMLQVNKIISNISRGISNFYIKSNHPLRAVRFLEIALKALPDDRNLYFMLANAQRTAGLRDASIHTLENAINNFPKDFDLLWTLGVWHVQYRRRAKALEYLIPYLDHWTDKDNRGGLANVHAVIGLCYLSLKRWEDAEGFLYKSRELAFWDLDACVGIIALYSCTGHMEKIPAILNEYIQHGAAFAALHPPYFWMGHYYHYSLHRAKDSIEWYRKALERIIDPDVRDYCNAYVEASDLFDSLLDEYIDALMACGQNNLILAEIQKYERYKIGAPVESRRRLIDVYTDLGDFAQAEKFARSTPGVFKDTPEILSAIARMEYKKGEIDKALNIIKQVLLIDNEFSQALDILGSIQTDKRMWDAAIETYEMLIKQSPFAIDWLQSLGLCYLNKNQIERARECYEESLRYDELDADAWVDLGDIYAKLGNADLAFSAFQRALKYDWLDNDKRQQALQAIDQLKS